jgi:hypothetical protein
VAETNTTRDTAADLPSILVKVTCTTPGVDDGPIASFPHDSDASPLSAPEKPTGFRCWSRVSRSLTFIHHGQVRVRGGGGKFDWRTYRRGSHAEFSWLLRRRRRSGKEAPPAITPKADAITALANMAHQSARKEKEPGRRGGWKWVGPTER